MTYPPIDPALVEPPYPLESHLGYEIVSWSPDYAVFRMPLQTVHQNRYGLPHGGLYTVLIDTVIGYAGCYTGDGGQRRLAMTLSLTTNYIAQPTGGVLYAEGHRIGGGKKIFFGEATVRDDNGIVCARGTGTFRYRQGGAG